MTTQYDILNYAPIEAINFAILELTNYGGPDSAIVTLNKAKDNYYSKQELNKKACKSETFLL